MCGTDTARMGCASTDCAVKKNLPMYWRMCQNC